MSSLLLVALATSCAGTERDGVEAVERPAHRSDDCVSPFVFDDREYLLAPGPDAKSVEPGGRLGEGAYESCAQYAGGSDKPLAAPRAVYGFPGAPAAQAVVLTDTKGEGTVLLAIDRPRRGWDPELRPWAVLVD